jgi:hypothetical protein
MSLSRYSIGSLRFAESEIPHFHGLENSWQELSGFMPPRLLALIRIVLPDQTIATGSESCLKKIDRPQKGRGAAP